MLHTVTKLSFRIFRHNFLRVILSESRKLNMRGVGGGVGPERGGGWLENFLNKNKREGRENNSRICRSNNVIFSGYYFCISEHIGRFSNQH